jgi:hypothetical protein
MTTHLPPAIAAGIFAMLISPMSMKAQPQRAKAAGGYTFEPVPFGMQLKTPDGRVVFDYLTKKPDDVNLTSPSVACFHPVNTPTGERVTAIAPDDHPHHRGMYTAWHDAEFREPLDPARRTPTSALYGWNVTKVDFWGWGQYAPREGRVIQTRDIKLVSANAAAAQIEIHNDWSVNTRKMADETTTAIVAEREGVYVIDIAFRLSVLVDYQLNKQGFSGFNFQARKDGESHYTYAGGVVKLPDAHYSAPETNWPGAPWYGYVITLRNGKTVGAAVLDHPSNPPTTWHGSRGLWMLNPNIAAVGPITIKTGSPLTLHYRVVVHDGDTPTALVNKLSDEWRAAKF